MRNAWQEASEYSDRERAALAWSEAVTLISVHHLPDEIYVETVCVSPTGNRGSQPCCDEHQFMEPAFDRRSVRTGTRMRSRINVD